MADDGRTVSVIDPSTGELHALAPADAQEAFVAGKMHLPVGAKIPLVAADGTVMDFPSDKVQEAMTKGWSMADRNQVLTADARTQGTQAALEGMAAGLTFQGSDLLLSQAGVEGMKQRRETGAGKNAELLGMGAGIIGTLGAGAAVEGAGQVAARGLAGRVATGIADAALAPTRALNALGAVAEAGATRATAEMGASGVASRLLGQAAGRGLEGATIGAVGAMAEESMGNPEANAAQLLAAGGMGALVGGAFGAATGVGVQALSEGLGRLAAGKASVIAADADGVTRALTDAGMAAPERSLAQKFSDYIVDKTKAAAKAAYDAGNAVAVKVGGYAAEDIERINSPAYQEFIRGGERAINESANKLGNVIDQVTARATTAEAENASRFLNTRYMVEHSIPAEAVTDAVVETSQRIADVRTAIEQIVRDEEVLGLGAGGGSRLLKKASDAADEMESRVFATSGVERKYMGSVTRKGPLGADITFQQQRTRSMEEVAGLYDLPPETAAEGFKSLMQMADVLRQVKTKNPAVAATVDGVLGKLDGSLAKSELWGPAAADVVTLRKAQDAGAEAMAQLKGKLRFQDDGKVDRASVVNYLKSLTSMQGEDAAPVDAIQKWIAARSTVAKSIENVAGIPEHAEHGVVERLGAEFGAAHKDLAERVVAFNVLDRVARQHSQQTGVGIGPLGYVGTGLAHTAVGALGLGPIGHIGAGIGIQAALDPVRAATMRAHSGASIDKARAVLSGAVDKVLGLPAKALPVSAERTRNLARTTMRLIDAKSDSERRAAFRERVAEIAEMNSSAHAMERNKRLMAIGGHMPKTAAAMDAKAAFAAQLLLSSIPQPRPTPGGFQMREPQYSDAAIRRFARIDRAVQDPVGIVERAGSGEMSAEDAHVWNTLYPELREQVMAKAVAAMADGHVLSRSQEETLLRLTGSANPARPAHLQRLQALHSAAAAPSPAPRAPTPAQSQRRVQSQLSAADALIGK